MERARKVIWIQNVPVAHPFKDEGVRGAREIAPEAVKSLRSQKAGPELQGNVGAPTFKVIL
jgi:hypothetical protein